MAKLALNNITSGFATNTALNANFDAIETALENTLSRDGTTPNFMTADLDMNSYRILNCADILTSGNLIAKGEWVALTCYTKGDLVNVGTQTYIAVDDYCASAVFANDSAHWQELFIEYVSVSGGGGGTGTPGLPDASTDDGSGWVLYTNGVTSYWTQVSTLADTATNTFAVHSFISDGTETTITLPFAYTIGGKNLIVMINGVVNYPSDDYTEDTATTFTFIIPPSVGDKVRVIANIITSAYIPTDATLAALYTLTPAVNKFPYFTSGTTAALESISAFVRSIMNSTDAAAFLTAIGAASAGTYSQFAVAQTWQDVKASRAAGSVYPNSTGKPIEVIIAAGGGSANGGNVYAGTNPVLTSNPILGFCDASAPTTFSVPINQYYGIASGATINYWTELR